MTFTLIMPQGLFIMLFTILLIIGIITFSINLYFFAMTISNDLFLKSVTLSENCQPDGRRVSVLIPARNEEPNISTCLDSLLCQNFGNYEILIYDDHSTDNTSSILKRYQENNPKLIKLIKAVPLEKGWKGKTFALQQMIPKSTGDILICIDADMIASPTLIDFTLSSMKQYQADCLSGWPKHILKRKTDSLLTPLVYLATSFLFPVKFIPVLRTSLLAHAIGQFMAFDKEMLVNIGGFSSVKEKINEDIHIARAVKKAGYKQLLVDAKDHIQGEMYEGLKPAFINMERVIFDYLGNSLIKTILLACLIFFSILMPIVMFPVALILNSTASILFGLSIILFVTGWTTALLSRKMPLFSSLLYPIQFTLLLFIAFKSAANSLSGKGYIWKDRKV